MIRTDYLRYCNVIELFYTGRNGNQEAQYVLPLVLGKGKIKYINEPLYRYNIRERTSHRSYSGNHANSTKRWNGLNISFHETIHRMPISEEYKIRLCAVSDLVHNAVLVKDALEFGFSFRILADTIDTLFECTRMYYKPTIEINSGLVQKYCLLFCAAVEDSVLGKLHKKAEVPTGKVIAWGALGRNAKVLLPYLKGSDIEPDEMWDAEGDGIEVKKPDMDSLSANDLLLVIPTWNGGIVNAIKTSKCGNYLCYDDILTHLAMGVFPEFYNGALKFDP
jgi:hypothetical protein